MKYVRHTKYFSIISGDCNTNRSQDLMVLAPLSFQCPDTVDKSNLNTLNTQALTGRMWKTTSSTDYWWTHILKVIFPETNLLLAPAPPTKRFWGYLSLILFKFMFFVATTYTSPPFPPCPPRRGRPMPPLPPRTYRRRLSRKFPYCREKTERVMSNKNIMKRSELSCWIKRMT